MHDNDITVQPPAGSVDDANATIDSQIHGGMWDVRYGVRTPWGVVWCKDEFEARSWAASARPRDLGPDGPVVVSGWVWYGPDLDHAGTTRPPAYEVLARVFLEGVDTELDEDDQFGEPFTDEDVTELAASKPFRRLVDQITLQVTGTAAHQATATGAESTR